MKKLLLPWLLFFLFACSSQECYEKKFPETGWSYADSLDFVFHITDSSSKTLRLNFSVTEEYPYKNLYLQFRVIPPEGNSQSSLSNFILMDAEGKWYVSRSFFGKEYRFSRPIAENLHFPAPGKYTVRVIQFMRDDTLRGITGLKLCME